MECTLCEVGCVVSTESHHSKKCLNICLAGWRWKDFDSLGFLCIWQAAIRGYDMTK